MRVVVQVVTKSSVKVNEEIIGKTEKGYMLLVGFTQTDTLDNAKKMALKIANLRIFNDENDKLNLSIKDVNGTILSISQFTLYGDSKKGNRPSFVSALSGDKAKPLYDYFNEELRKYDLHVEEGVFGAHMEVELINYGPTTIILEN